MTYDSSEVPENLTRSIYIVLLKKANEYDLHQTISLIYNIIRILMKRAFSRI